MTLLLLLLRILLLLLYYNYYEIVNIYSLCMSLLAYDEYVVTDYDVVQGFIFGIKTIIKMHNSFCRF